MAALRSGKTVTPRRGSLRRSDAASGMVLAAGMMAGVTMTPAKAQTFEAVEQVEQAISNQNRLLERFSQPQKRGTIDISIDDERRLVSPEEARRIRFPLRSVILEGVDILPESKLLPIWQARLGSTISLAELYDIAEGIDAAYREAGYFMATAIPPQDFASGHVRLVLPPSYIDDIVIDSTVPDIRRRLSPYIDRLTAMRPVRIKEVERVLLLMSDLGGVSVEGVVRRPDRPGAGGSITLEIKVRPFKAEVALDNLGSSSSGPLELSAVAQANDLLRWFETTTLVGVTVPDTPDELLLAQLSQDIPIGTDGLFAGFSLSHVSSRPGAELAPLDLAIASYVASAYLSYPFLRTIERNVYGRLELNAKDTSVDAAGIAMVRDDVRWLAAVLDYDQDIGEGSLGLSMTFGQGVDGLGASNAAVDLVARAGTPEDYRFWRLDLDVRHPLWQDADIRLRGTGQYSADPLPSAVQMTLGGDPYGRAFDGASAAGDSGAAAAIEVSQRFEPPVDFLSRTELFGFVDYGVLWNHDIGVDYEREALGSVGVGLRGAIGEHMKAQFLVAVPWEDEQGLTDTGNRLFFKLSTQF